MGIDQKVGLPLQGCGQGGDPLQIAVKITSPDGGLDRGETRGRQRAGRRHPLGHRASRDARGVDREHCLKRTTQQTVDRLAEHLAGQVPEGDVHPGDGLKLVAGDMSSEPHAAVHPLPMVLDGQGLVADEQRGQDLGDHGAGHLGAERGVGLAPTDGAILGHHPHQAGLGPGRIDTQGQRIGPMERPVGRGRSDRVQAHPGDIIQRSAQNVRLDPRDPWHGTARAVRSGTGFAVIVANDAASPQLPFDHA